MNFDNFFTRFFFAALSPWNDRVLLLRQDLMVQAEILAGSVGTENSLLQAGILTREEAVKEMREMGGGIGVMQGDELIKKIRKVARHAAL